MLTNGITISCTTIRLGVLSDDDLARLRAEIVREETSRRRASERELEVPLPKVFPGMSP